MASTSSQIPDLTREQLVDYLVRVDKNAMKLCGVKNGHAVFKSQITYPLTQRTKARYGVLGWIPLSDPMFQSTELITYAYPSQLAPRLQFKFENYIDNSGMARSWVE